MVPTSEFRLGNYVIDKLRNNRMRPLGAISTRYTGLMEQVMFDHSTDNWQHCRDIDPIPITPKILEKCGFVKTDCGFVITETDEFRSKLTLQLHDEKTYKFDCSGFWYGINHLHQLQNLYYILTGSELTIPILNGKFD